MNKIRKMYEELKESFEKEDETIDWGRANYEWFETTVKEKINEDMSEGGEIWEYIQEEIIDNFEIDDEEDDDEDESDDDWSFSEDTSEKTKEEKLAELKEEIKAKVLKGEDFNLEELKKERGL